MNAPENMRITNLLTDYVDGQVPLDRLLVQYNLSYHEVSELVQLTDRLKASLVEVTPSAAFVANLYDELINQAPRRAWWQVSMPRSVQNMSNRTKIAASIGGLTLVYLTARSLNNWLNREQDDPVTAGELIA
jgi:hypothetical protein